MTRFEDSSFLMTVDATPPTANHPTELDIQIAEPFAAHVSSAWLRLVAHEALAHLDSQNDRWALTIVITDDEPLRRLNRTYLGKDASTDVLAFGGESPDFVTTPSAEQYLGDVIISYPRAQAQAKGAGHRVEAELALLTVHGILHLWGYDHIRSQDKAVMWKLQKEILARLDLAHVAP